MFPQLKIAIGNLLLIDSIEFHWLPQHEQQLLSPVPFQTLGNILCGCATFLWKVKRSCIEKPSNPQTCRSGDYSEGQ
jgi:hypothetical protein